MQEEAESLQVLHLELQFKQLFPEKYLPYGHVSVQPPFNITAGHSE